MCFFKNCFRFQNKAYNFDKVHVYKIGENLETLQLPIELMFISREGVRKLNYGVQFFK